MRDKIEDLKDQMGRYARYSEDSLKRYKDEERYLKNEILLDLNKRMQCYHDGALKAYEDVLYSLNFILEGDRSNG